MRKYSVLFICGLAAVLALAVLYTPFFSGISLPFPASSVFVSPILELPQGEEPSPEREGNDNERSQSSAPAVRYPMIRGEQRVEYRIPFIPQAPGGKWDDPLFKDACEEASTLMATLFVKGLPAPKDIGAALHAAGAYAERTFGHHVDTSAADTLRMLREYHGVESAELVEAPSVSFLKNTLAADAVIIAPTNGRKLGNPHFQNPGPEYHMIVIIGYDEKRNVFITHDPGTRVGAYYAYNTDVLMGAIADYPTGHHEHTESRAARVIVVRKEAPAVVAPSMGN